MYRTRLGKNCYPICTRHNCYPMGKKCYPPCSMLYAVFRCTVRCIDGPSWTTVRCTFKHCTLYRWTVMDELNIYVYDALQYSHSLLFVILSQLQMRTPGIEPTTTSFSKLLQTFWKLQKTSSGIEHRTIRIWPRELNRYVTRPEKRRPALITLKYTDMLRVCIATGLSKPPTATVRTAHCRDWNRIRFWNP